MNNKLTISITTAGDELDINRIRHDVYASELEQFALLECGMLPDRPDVACTYIKCQSEGELIGFVGITAPSSPQYSIDHYVDRTRLPVSFGRHLYEIRALTVVETARGSSAAPALMYAAFRWIQAHGGKQIIAIGHARVRAMYQRLGMRPLGIRFPCGKLQYDVLTASTETIQQELMRFDARLDRLEKQVEWRLEIPFRAPSECYHGGAFFDAIGNRFEQMERRNEIINADVLDAWFPPCCEAQQALHEHLGWIMRTSPPNHAEGLVDTIAHVRGVEPENILCGGGSSPLIFTAFRSWLTSSSRVLLLDPTYGEYAHVLEKVVKCNVERFTLQRENGYQLDLNALSDKLCEGYDLFVWVNPNSPTGRHVARSEVEAVLEQCPSSTRVWMDETYVEYAGPGQSLETYAARVDHVVVCKSMSKVYGLSGLRAGYLCASPAVLEPLREIIPPWSVSLPAQVAAIHALHAPVYYAERYAETRQLRNELELGLKRLGIHEIVPGIANFILCHLPSDGLSGSTVITRCREEGLFIRDAAEMGTGMGDRAIRIAVKDRKTNARTLEIIQHALSSTPEYMEVHHD